MKELARQDRNGTRTSEELRRRYKLNEIELTKEEVEYLKQFIEVDDALSTSSIHPVQNKVITQVLNNKVNKETGKDLSSNDFTNDFKEQIEANTELRHTHSNKSVLDGITSTLIDNWNNAATNAHSVSNSSRDYQNTAKIGDKILIQSGRTTARVTTGGTAILLSFNFPVAFKNAPTLIVQPSTSEPQSIWSTPADSTTTEGKYWFYRPDTSATIIEWLAIGEPNSN